MGYFHRGQTTGTRWNESIFQQQHKGHCYLVYSIRVRSMELHLTVELYPSGNNALRLRRTHLEDAILWLHRYMSIKKVRHKIQFVST